ncbi:hypothetical protein L228DRAFT_251632 [Xylona heveae TC161]|uniref:Uncharacterized protein n=1 Tax=Xylona heveae (strain CBS 132557 / TC161) TaxID=1328760 RepID=A0A164ZGF2_XYLHT|nr:hypothetical protein L228DRAFT_251632 [Xylona heveae TC161]KZF19072.1 hypothetical protein L228DRAFT_251632 [Xylona heveae TC161]
MSAEYQGEDPLVIAQKAERDLNSYQAKTGKGQQGSSVTESGVDEVKASKFPGADVTYGSAASGSGDNREIPVEEGGELKGGSTGMPTKARDFEGPGGPETKQAQYEETNPGNDEVRANVSNQL